MKWRKWRMRKWWSNEDNENDNEMIMIMVMKVKIMIMNDVIIMTMIEKINE